jgi:hypothetical protein
VPDSADQSLADVFPSAAAALGCPGFRDVLGLGTPSTIVCLLVDGLGYEALKRSDPNWLASSRIRPISSVLPTTTAVALTSLGTGSLPGTHGVVAASFVLPETGEVLSPLHWGSAPVPEAIQVEPTIPELMARHGIACHTVGPLNYAHSGLTRAALRGPTYHGARDIDDYVGRVRDIQRRGDRSFTYVYWPELDRIGHTRGVADPEWDSGLDRVGRLTAGIQAGLRADGLLLVTSDHGMVSCPPERRIRWDDLRGLHRGVTHMSGEPRCRLIYLDRVVDLDETARMWRERLEPDFDVWTRHQLHESGLMGEFEAFAAERLGDLVILATGDAMLSCPGIDPRISSLLGQHGSWTDEERWVPLAVLPGG